MEFLNLNNEWTDILIESTGSTSMFADPIYASVMKKNGMLSMATVNQNKNSVDYELCWRLGQWNTLVEGHSEVNTLNDIEKEFKKHHFNSMKCLHNREENNTLAAIKNARQCILSILREVSIECLQSVYKYLTWLQQLQQCEEFCMVIYACFFTNHNSITNY